MQMLGLDSEIEAKVLISDFEKLGIPFEVAKKCAIRVLREKIEELQFIDGAHFVGLKPRMDIHRQTILYIIEL
jgi:hypothetical protein